MSCFTTAPVTRTLAAALMSAGLLAGPVAAAELAQNAAPATAAPAPTPAPDASAPAPQTSTPSKSAQGGQSKTKRSRADAVDARIAALHDELKITPEQSAKWNDVAQVMRENAQSMQTLVRQRSRSAEAMTAVDDLRSYEEIAEAHANGVKRLIPAFEALYDTMSPEQKKAADAAFRHRGQHAAHKAASSRPAG